MDTKVEYLGLELKSPIIAGSCGITSDVDNIVRLEEAGAGAVVLKSLFEEQIIHDIKRNTSTFAPIDNYGESYEYIAHHTASDTVTKFFTLISEAKKRTSIPIIGSINGCSYDSWVSYAKNFQEAGCDALEVNLSILPYDVSLSTDDVERTFYNVVQALRKAVSIPISIKVSSYFTDLAKFMQQLSWSGVSGITIFNKSLCIDVDTEKEEVCHADSLSHEGELYNTIRWTAILAKKLRCDLSATTGVSTADDVVKLLLTGAKTVQVASSLYRNGVGYMKDLNDGLRAWMAQKGYECVGDFAGKLALKPNEKSSILFRTQFMRYFAEIQ